MILAQELRIGNYVGLLTEPNPVKIPSGLFLRVDSVTKGIIEAFFHAEKKYSVSANVYSTHQIHGIPLSEEWFERFGANRSHHGFWELQSECGFNITWDEDGLDLSQPNVDFAEPLQHIKHVHQLQNLFFALTQKELDLNKGDGA